MAAATTSRRGPFIAETPKGVETVANADAGRTYLAGTLGTIDSSGVVQPYADGSQGNVVGLIREEKIIPAGTDGDYTMSLWRDVVAKFVGSGLAIGNVGDLVYADDNQTVVLTPNGTETLLGEIVQFESATAVWVHILPNAGKVQNS